MQDKENEEESRWEKPETVKQIWEKMLEDNPSDEIIIAGDFNFDANALFKDPKTLSKYENRYTLVFNC